MNDDGFAHLGKPLLQALRRFLTGAATGCSAADLRRAIAPAKALQAVLENDLLLETELAARGCRRVKSVSTTTLRRRCYEANTKCESLRVRLDQFKAKVNKRIAWRWAVMAGLASVATLWEIFGFILFQMNKQDAAVPAAPAAAPPAPALAATPAAAPTALAAPAAAPAAPALAAAPAAIPAAFAAPAAGPAAPAPPPRRASPCECRPRCVGECLFFCQGRMLIRYGRSRGGHFNKIPMQLK